MGEIRKPRPALLLLAVFSRHEAALQWSRQTAEQRWGPVALHSDVFSFDQTPFYEKTMGGNLRKMFLAFESLIDPGRLVEFKKATNDWEDQYAQESRWPETRPVNLDPGYLTEAKLVLATTKDRDHRIYLSHGIYAEGTLHFHAGSWQTRPWTYPDYQREEYHQFFSQCRDYLRRRLRGSAGST